MGLSSVFGGLERWRVTSVGVESFLKEQAYCGPGARVRGGQEHPGGLDFGHGNANKLAGAQEGGYIFLKDLCTRERAKMRDGK